MESLATLAIVDGSVGLIAKCFKAVQGLHDLIMEYKHAELAIVSMIHELDVVQMAWEQMSSRINNRNEKEPVDGEVLERIKRSLDCGMIVMSALERDLAYYRSSAKSFGLSQRMRSVWDSSTFQSHLDRIRGQALSMTLLVTVIKL